MGIKCYKNLKIFKNFCTLNIKCEYSSVRRSSRSRSGKFFKICFFGCECNNKVKYPVYVTEYRV
jgi:hypothetical protein